MTAKLMALLAFAGDSEGIDVDRAADELRRAGYTVHRLPDSIRRRISVSGDDFLEAHLEGSDDPKVVDAMEREVDAIARKYGWDCVESGPIERDHVPFAELFEDVDRVPVQ